MEVVFLRAIPAAAAVIWLRMHSHDNLLVHMLDPLHARLAVA
jgi:hypothetical protein